jgi:hypothetical protein
MDLVSITGASFGNEEQPVGQALEPHRSQKGRITALSKTGSSTKDKVHFHVISYSSTVIGSVCRATLQAETYSLSSGFEEAMRIRAGITRRPWYAGLGKVGRVSQKVHERDLVG